MAKIQDYSFNALYYLITENKIKHIRCYDLAENLLIVFNSENIDDLIAKIKIFENKLKSGIYTFKCKISENATNEFCYNVTKSVSYEEIDNSKPYAEKIFEHDIEKEIRRKIDFENRELELEKRQKEISQKERMLNGFANQGSQIVERIGMIIFEKYKPLFIPNEPQNFEHTENYETETENNMNGFESEREIDTLFTLEEQNKLVELLKNNQMYLDTVRNMIKN